MLVYLLSKEYICLWGRVSKTTERLRPFRSLQVQGATRTAAEAYWKYVEAEDRRSNAADEGLLTAVLQFPIGGS